MMMDSVNADNNRFSFPASILNEKQREQQAEWDAAQPKQPIKSVQTPQPAAVAAPPPAPAPAQQQPSSSSSSSTTPAQPQTKIPISRVTRACDRCTHKKLRCDGTIVPDMHGQPPAVIKGCTRCMFAHTPCEYTRVQKRRGPSPGFKRRKLSNESAASSGSVTGMAGSNKAGHSGHSPASSTDSTSQSQQFSLTHRRRTLSQQSQPQSQPQPQPQPAHLPQYTHTPPPPPPALKTIPTSAVSNAPSNLTYSPQPPLQRHHSANITGMADMASVAGMASANAYNHSHAHSIHPLPTTPSTVKLPSIANWFGPRGHPSLHR